jgi:uncharacterized protein
MTVEATGWREALSELIAREAKPREKYGHQPRLYDLTRQVGQGLSYDDDVVYAATWLHDLGVFEGHRPEDKELLERWDSVAYAVDRSPAILESLGFPADKVDLVLDCIRTHQPQCEPLTMEATVLRDADILEQLGAVGILRTVCKVGRDTRFATFTDAVRSLHAALTRLPEMLRLPQSKVLAGSRIVTLSGFLAAAAAESQAHLH